MPAVEVITKEGRQTREVGLPEEVNVHILWEVVRWQLAKRRAGTASTKTRGEVSFSGKKIWPQKGLGRARHGDRGAPIFVRGGVAFGPKPRNYSYTLPKKVRRKGLAMALGDRARNGKLTVVESFDGVQGKTKSFLAWAKANGFDGSERVLLVTENELVRRAARNLPWVSVLEPEGINVYDILRHERLVMDEPAFQLALSRAGVGGEA